MLRELLVSRPQADERPELLDLEKRLREDPDGVYRRDVLFQLETARRGVQKEMDRGVTPDEYRRLTQVIDALSAAIRVVESLPPRR